MDSSLILALTNFGALGVVLVFVMIGWLVPKPFYDKLQEENRALRESRDMERQRGNDADQAGRVTNQLIASLQELAEEKGRRRHDDPGLTWKDIN